MAILKPEDRNAYPWYVSATKMREERAREEFLLDFENFQVSLEQTPVYASALQEAQEELKQLEEKVRGLRGFIFAGWAKLGIHRFPLEGGGGFVIVPRSQHSVDEDAVCAILEPDRWASVTVPRRDLSPERLLEEVDAKLIDRDAFLNLVTVKAVPKLDPLGAKTAPKERARTISRSSGKPYPATDPS